METRTIVGLLITAAILVVFTIFGFFAPQTCDIDKVFLYCRLHPFTFLDFIGCVLFYGGALLLGGITKLFKIQLTNAAGSSTWNWVSFIALALGAILIWV